MTADALYDAATISGKLLGKYLDDGKVSKADIFGTLLSDLGEILAFINTAKDIPAELLDLDREEAQEAARLFHEALGPNVDKTKADEAFGDVLRAIPAGRDALAAARSDASLAAKWEALKPAGDALVAILSYFIK